MVGNVDLKTRMKASYAFKYPSPSESPTLKKSFAPTNSPEGLRKPACFTKVLVSRNVKSPLPSTSAEVKKVFTVTNSLHSFSGLIHKLQLHLSPRFTATPWSK